MERADRSLKGGDAITDLRLETLFAEFDPSCLHGQYVCGRTLPAVPDSWQVVQFAGWTLAHHAALPVLDLVDANGAQVGWLLGHLIDPAGEVAASKVSTPHAVEDEDFGRRVGEWLYTHGGRYLAVLVRPEALVYPDPYTLLPALYRPDTACFSSSPFLLPDKDGGLVERSVAATLDVAGGHTQWYPLGTSPVEGVDQLLANHVLDLRTWRQSRLWPLSAPEPLTVEEAAERIAAAIEPVAVAAARVGSPRMGLTAGGDTRTVLAFLRPVVDDFRFVTLQLGDDLAQTDERWATRIAARFDLSHQMVPMRPVTEKETRLFFYRTGAMNGNLRARFTGPTWAAAIREPAIVLAGGGGDVLGAAHLRDIRGRKRYERLEKDGLEPDDILRIVGAPPELRERADALLAELPPMSAMDAVQVMLIESCAAPWHGTLTLPVPEMDPLLHPLTHRSVTEAALGVSLRDRLDNRLRRAVIASRWPELLEFPFNRDPVPVALRRRAGRAGGYGRAALRRIGHWSGRPRRA